MTKLNTHTKRTAVIIALLILFAMFLRMMSPHLPANNLRGLIYIGLFTAWGISVRKRIIQVQVRRHLTAISVMMVFWVVVRSMKFMLFADTHLGRYCWYLYYLPLLFIPLLVLLVALSLGKPEDYSLPGWANYLFLVPAALLILVLTNDFHQLAFAFPKGLLFFDNDDYSHELIYYLSIGWMALCAVTAFAFMIVKCHVPRQKKRIWLPCALLSALIVYNILCAVAWDLIKVFAGDMTVVCCLLITATLESCIQCGLIQSNTHYQELFRGCRINAVIVDNEYEAQYTAAAALELSQEQMRSAEQQTMELDEGMILRSMPLGNGHILWLEDVSELQRLQQELESNAALLSEETELLAEEVRQKEEKASTDIRNRLYDTVAHEIAPQIEEIDRLIAKRPADMEARKTALKRMCVLGAYVKRRCNLIFLNEQKKITSSAELYYCLQESAEYIMQYGVPCSVDNISQRNVSIEHAKLAYGFFEAVIENALETLTAFSARIIATKDELVLKLMAECTGIDLHDCDQYRRVEQAGGRIETDYADGVWNCTLSLPEGVVYDAGTKEKNHASICN